MTMPINLSSEMEGFIKQKVATALYGNATEVIRDAIKRMQAEQMRATAWQAAIKQGDDEFDRGEGVTCNAELIKEIF